MTLHLHVDPIACTGHGLCAELFPELIELDDWGYPIVAAGDIPDELVRHARMAAEACPVLAITLRRRQQAAAPERAVQRRVLQTR
jgi:ferredoxin